MALDTAARQMPARWRSTALLGVVAADGIAANIVLPVLPFLGGDLGAGPAAIGLLFAAYPIAQFVTAPLWGRFADRFSAKRLLTMALLVIGAGHLMFAMASSFTMLFSARVVAGLGGAVLLLVETHVVRTVPRDQRTGQLGRISAMQGVGTMLGPVLGSLLIRGGAVAVGLGAFGVAVVTLLVVALVLPGDRAEKAARESAAAPGRLSALGTAVRDSRLRALTLYTFLGWTCFAGFAAVLPLHLEARLEVGAGTYGYILAVSGVVAFVVRGMLVGRLARRFGERRLVSCGALFIAAAMLLTVVVPSVAWTPLLPFLYACGAGLFFPSLMTEITARAGDQAVGSVIGGITMASTAGVLAGPLALGFLTQFGGQVAPFLTGGLLLTVVAVLAFVTLRSDRKDGTDVHNPVEAADLGANGGDRR
ncbi:MFS transporter [Streptomyces sp. CC219B]|uniref:MFS transporter n=1 Tax=Streptomyces sp. CC219B TaxID=3044574 RepID=UPI0024A94906|nr:MFS transporter [Streptomyces sp. CC219B]